MELKRLSYKHKNNKLLYYIHNYLRLLVPSSFYQNKLKRKLETLSDLDKDTVLFRVNYYNKLETTASLSETAKPLNSLEKSKGFRTYFFDLYEYSRYFKQSLKGHFLFGDITHIPDAPSLTKSRPIAENNHNAVILKWDKIRHFTFVKKDKPFINKTHKLIWRGKVHLPQPHRIRFLEQYHNHPMCNIGRVNANTLDPTWLKERITISEHLNYKFILCLEGNDVASNLKWVMSSNSIAVMPTPKFETWFMEGLLIADHHYIHIKDDYSDLEEKLNYYNTHPEKALQIIKNAHNYITQFQNKTVEDLASLLVLKKYFEKTKQL